MTTTMQAENLRHLLRITSDPGGFAVHLDEVSDQRRPLGAHRRRPARSDTRPARRRRGGARRPRSFRPTPPGGMIDPTYESVT